MITITDYLKDGNVSACWNAALQAALQQPDRTVFFPKGEYHFYETGCAQKYCWFSNNDEGVKTIAILLKNVDGLTIRGDQALWIFHGRISPICAFGCRDLTVEGIAIDFEESFVSDADLVRREDGIAWFRFAGKHKVENGRISFVGDFYDNLNGQLPFYCYDGKRQELLPDKRAITVPNRNVLSRGGLVGLEDRFADAGTTEFLVKHQLRFCPGIVCDSCRNTMIRNVTLHHAAGMGVLMQTSEDCTLDGLKVIPRNRRAAVSDDALHITDCRGKLRILNSLLTGTLDDSINVHGVFRKFKMRAPGGKFYYLESGHYQQQGVFGIRPGDTLELLKRETGKPYGRLRITDVVPICKAFIKIVFDEKELPEEFYCGDPGWILETRADLEVRNTECRPLNGRGVLASGMKSVLISGCRFHSSGAGVFVSGDYGFWYESGPVEKMVVEDNLFDNCNYRQFSATQEPLAVFPELVSTPEGFYYHGSIAVRNNRFVSAERPLVSMLSVAEAEVTDNEFVRDDSYRFVPCPQAGYSFTTAESPMAAFCHCGHVTERNNRNFRA